MSMAIQIWPLGSRYNPHRISSSFYISSGSTNTTLANQNHDPRPHVNISLYNSIFSALLDTGASVCLIDGTIVDNLIQQGHKFSSSSSTVFIQDCHSAVQESLGCFFGPSLGGIFLEMSRSSCVCQSPQYICLIYLCVQKS